MGSLISQHAFRMPMTTRSEETATKSYQVNNRMKSRFAKIEEGLRLMIMEMENLQKKKNDVLRQRSAENSTSSHSKRNKAELQNSCGMRKRGRHIKTCVISWKNMRRWPRK